MHKDYLHVSISYPLHTPLSLFTAAAEPSMPSGFECRPRMGGVFWGADWKLIGGGFFPGGGFCPAALRGVLIVFNHWGQCPAALEGVLIVFNHWGQYPCFIVLYITDNNH